MSWAWVLTDVAGDVLAPVILADAAGDAVVGGARSSGQPAPGGGETVVFGSQGDAETWLGEHWRVLAAAGVAAASLDEDGREVYGPLPLQT